MQGCILNRTEYKASTGHSESLPSRTTDRGFLGSSLPDWGLMGHSCSWKPDTGGLLEHLNMSRAPFRPFPRAQAQVSGGSFITELAGRTKPNIRPTTCTDSITNRRGIEEIPDPAL